MGGWKTEMFKSLKKNKHDRRNNNKFKMNNKNKISQNDGKTHQQQ